MDFFKQIFSEQSFNGRRCRSYDTAGKNHGNARDIFECQGKVDTVRNDGKLRESGQFHPKCVSRGAGIKKDTHMIFHKGYSRIGNHFLFFLIFQRTFIKVISPSGQFLLIGRIVAIYSTTMCFCQKFLFVHLI